METLKADLHIHTRYSGDGEADPAWIAAECAARGIKVFTVTDHNVVGGAREIAQGMAGGLYGEGLTFVPGIEIDCFYGETHMHLLGLGIDVDSPDFTVLEKDVDRLSRQAFEGMVENIRRCGFPVDRQRVLDVAGGLVPTGEHIVEAMLTDENRGCELLEPYYPGGARSDMPVFNFYFDWFAQGCPAYVPVEYMPFADAVELIRGNGGIPVIAHPGQNFKGKEQLAVGLLGRGAEGLECFNNYHTPVQTEFFAQAVTGRNALLTCGSDFHGKVKPLISLGQYPSPDRYTDYFGKSVERLAARHR